MQTFILRNPGNTLLVQYKTDRIDANENFTVMEVLGADEAEIRFGVDLRQQVTSLAELEALASNLALILEVVDGDTKTQLADNSVALDITTTTLPDTVTPAWEQEEITVTYDTFANSGQADYLHIINTAGKKFAIWLDKDDAGTAPTGALYVAANYKIKVGIATGDDAQAVGNKVAAVLAANLDWVNWADISFVDNDDGTVTFTQDIPGNVTDAAPKNADDSGAGSIGITKDNEGVDGTEYDQTLAATGGNGDYTWSIVSGALPGGLTLNTTTGQISGRAYQVGAAQAFTVRVTDDFSATDDQALTLTVVA